MNCAACREQLGAYADGLLDSGRDLEIARHLSACRPCQAEARLQHRLHEALCARRTAFAGADLTTPVLADIAARRAQQAAQNRQRRVAMARRVGKYAAGLAAAAAFVLVFFVPWGGKQQAQATAAEVLQQAISALGQLRSVHLLLNMRTVPGDNFELIMLDAPLVPVELWKEFGDPPRWRAENGGRTVVMDGTAVWCRTHVFGAKLPPEPTFRTWVGALLDVEQVLDTELRQAQLHHWPLTLEEATGPDGRRKLVVTVEAAAQGDFTNDWARNKSIAAADNRRVYRLDAETKRLEELALWVHGPAGDVLVLQTERITYDEPLADALFVLELPPDLPRYLDADEMPPAGGVVELTPDQVARQFFEAAARRDWEGVLRFWPVDKLDPRLEQFLGGLEVLEIGTPFRSGQYPGWYVPYRIRLQVGQELQHNLAVRNDNPQRRWIMDGGI
jgi:hypothetical protein